MDKELKALYALKGELTTRIEIANAQLRVVNEQITTALNKELSVNGEGDEEGFAPQAHE